MADKEQPTSTPDIESMFATVEGPLGRAFVRCRLARGRRLLAWRVAMLLSAVTWLPLLILAAIEGVAAGDRVAVPLLEDFLPYGQFLLAIPVLIFAEVMVGRRVGWAVAELRRSDILDPGETLALDDLLEGVVRRWRGHGVNAVLLFLTLVTTVVSVWGMGEWLTGEWQYGGERMTLPGWWYQLVSLPILRFLALRWLWRVMLWAWTLWKIARMKLNLQPAHPDRCGGLAFLGGAQTSFGWLVLALGIQLSCLVADAIFCRGVDLISYKLEFVAFVSIVLLVLLLPLLVFAPKLVYAREQHLIYLSGMGYQGIARLERLLHGAAVDEWPNDDNSGMADYCVLYENARLMRPIPLEIRHAGILVIVAVAPFVPLVFLSMPAEDVIRTLVDLLI